MGSVVEFPKLGPSDVTGLRTDDDLIARLGYERAFDVAASILLRCAMHRPDGRPSPAGFASILIDLHGAVRDLAVHARDYAADPKAFRRRWNRSTGAR